MDLEALSNRLNSRQRAIQSLRAQLYKEESKIMAIKKKIAKKVKKSEKSLKKVFTYPGT